MIYLRALADFVRHAGAQVADALNQLCGHTPPDCIHVYVPGEDRPVGCMVRASRQILRRQSGMSLEGLSSQSCLYLNSIFWKIPVAMTAPLCPLRCAQTRRLIGWLHGWRCEARLVRKGHFVNLWKAN